MKKYRMVFIDHESLSYSRQWVVRPLGMILMGTAALGLMTLLTGVLIVFTPLREWIPGYLDPDLKNEARELRAQADTLAAQLKAQEEIIQSLSKIDPLEVKHPADYSSAPDYSPDSNQDARDLPQPERPVATTQDDRPGGETMERKPPASSKMNLVPPVEGLITGKFSPDNAQDPHYGVDLVADENSLIRAVADGVVIFSEYSSQTGYVVGIAHSRDHLISFYKHNSRVFKKVGSRVFAGEAIAVIGNSGKHTSGTHLHFELWHENSPLNPEDYIIFR